MADEVRAAEAAETTQARQGEGAAAAAPAAGQGEGSGRNDAAKGDAAKGAPASLLDLAGQEAGQGQPAADGGQARPAWLPEQFWDPEGQAPKVEALFKSWKDMRDRVARGGLAAPETPDAYALPQVEGLARDAVPADDPLWAAVRQAAHKAGLSQAQLAAVAEPYLRAVAEQRGDPAAAAAEFAAEKAKLGPQAERVLAEVAGWIDGLAARGVFSEADRQAMRELSTAAQVRAWMRLREHYGEKPIPVQAMDPGGMTERDARRMLSEGLDKGDEGLAEKARRALREMEAKGMLQAR